MSRDDSSRGSSSRKSSSKERSPSERSSRVRSSRDAKLLVESSLLRTTLWSRSLVLRQKLRKVLEKLSSRIFLQQFSLRFWEYVPGFESRSYGSLFCNYILSGIFSTFDFILQVRRRSAVTRYRRKPAFVSCSSRLSLISLLLRLYGALGGQRY